ncbi:MAG: CDP-diacylglycerol--glycerol-3-phosphate 3-phosphatidyltransferase [Gammaproteobacteria bacterium RIFCSPHIGHO2_12_FULL_35_23]|nr:MAG: CDP-diacylglycerol--glycerol-3-phosphate 3-phosphatidyltransferase [Gammaproteobacteria bacterium RIFCSPHIGHO2_12_FULL_35_23]
MNLPTYLTLLRIALIPIFIIFYYLPWTWAKLFATLIFAFAAITDLLDGYLARKLKLTSKFGAFLDPVADKLIVTVVLVLLAANHHLPYLVIPIVVIIGREIVISGLREWMAELGKRARIAVSFMGKVKMVSQIFAIIFLLLSLPLASNFFLIIGYIGIYLAALITLWTMIVYIKAAWPDFEINSK